MPLFLEVPSIAAAITPFKGIQTTRRLTAPQRYRTSYYPSGVPTGDPFTSVISMDVKGFFFWSRSGNLNARRRQVAQLTLSILQRALKGIAEPTYEIDWTGVGGIRLISVLRETNERWFRKLPTGPGSN
jgi:hypothetical protein